MNVPTDSPGARHPAVEDEGPEILVRLVTRDVVALQHFLATNSIEVVRVLLPEGHDPAWATVLLREAVAERAARMAGFEVAVLARPPTTDAETPQVGRGNRYADAAVVPRGRGRLLR